LHARITVAFGAENLSRKGSQYVAERSVFDGEMQNHHWHEECLENAREINDECVWEFEPYSNERPEFVGGDETGKENGQ
jgi:hypothetical protein